MISLILALTALAASDDAVVGPTAEGGHVASTRQVLRPEGETLEFAGRPVDFAFSPDGATLFVSDNRGLVVVDVPSWSIRQELPFDKDFGASMHGIAVSNDGARVYVTTAQDRLYEGAVGEDGRVEWQRRIPLPGPGGKDASHATGIALTRGGATALVCLSRNNSVAVVNLETAAVDREIPVGTAPFAIVLAPDESAAFVSNWGGRRARPDDETADSSGTKVVVDKRGIAAAGSVSILDLAGGVEVAQIPTGLHPSGLALSPDGGLLYVANANSDTVSVVDLQSRSLRDTIPVRPDPALPFGSAPNALALSPDGDTLYAANGGNNAIAVVDLAANPPVLTGLIPAGWYPGALAIRNGRLFIANVKGVGSRSRDSTKEGWHVYWQRGSIQRVDIPGAAALEAMTARAREDARVPQALRAWERTEGGEKPVPVPNSIGAPSVFEHVVYIIKENRTYDQIFGKIGKGNSDPALCSFPRVYTPNHHALAEQFVLLDNYYCNGVNSADGHSWATEGNVTSYLEKSFGGFTRSYTFGDDPLTYSSSGFIWDNVIARGLSFRNYGEMNYTETVPPLATFSEVYNEYLHGAGKVTFTHSIGIENLRRYSHPSYPGWNMRIPDVYRAKVFLEELAEFEKSGAFPNLVMIYLPNDHTSGTKPGLPTPRAHVADNDLALGRIVEGISNSRFWPKTCIFINEDDPQDGYDHVDGHRSICLVVSPYTKRREIVSRFYNQTSVLHTIARILGTPPLNQMDSLAPLMTECFTETPNFTPYAALPNETPLDELNPEPDKLAEKERYWAELSLAQNFEQVDAAEEDDLNRILWHAMHGVDAAYPAEFAGAHAKGLAKLGLILDGSGDDD